MHNFDIIYFKLTAVVLSDLSVKENLSNDLRLNKEELELPLNWNCTEKPYSYQR